ncbi:MAG: urea carboxylase-associated family protein [Opitutales bacterium]|nr:urea carboxylase-associated family protein [Opitutales bacterium]
MKTETTTLLIPEPETKDLILQETVRGGGMWSYVLRRHRLLCLTDPEGRANAGMLFYNRENYLERYNMSDTLKAQHIARLTAPYTMHSDMGRVMMSIVGDTVGWHDTIGGFSRPAEVEKQFGKGTYQEKQNGFYRNGRDNFLIELGKWGLGKKDLMPNANFFSKVTVDEDGGIGFATDHRKPGDQVWLRAEMDLLVVLQTCHHPLDSAENYDPAPVEIAVWEGSPPSADDPCRLSRPENERAFINTETYLR